MAYTWTAPENPVGAYIAGFAIAPTLLFNRVTNSNAKLASKEVNLLQYALTSELGIGHVLGGTQYFRLRGGFLSDFDGTAKSWAATAEWQPVSTPAGLSVPVFFGALYYVFEPMVRLEYAKTFEPSKDPLFFVHDEAMRVGPIFVLTIGAKQFDTTPWWLKPLTAKTTYLFLYDTLSNQDYPLWTSSLSFNLDPDKHIALTLSYDNGRLEQTANKTEVTKLSLTFKW